MMQDGSTSSQRVRAAFDQLTDLPPESRVDALKNFDLTEHEQLSVRKLLAGLGKQRLFSRGAADWATQLGGVDYIDAMVGRQLGTCELVRFIGSGGSSIVYFANRRIGDTTQRVAVKLLNSGLMSPEAQRRFRREQAILSRFTHPNIARLIDAGMSDAGAPYIVMEYVEGLDIVNHAASKSLDSKARIGLLVDTCRAIDAAHRELVVHRDLKPSNVWVTDDGIVKVLDFGIAKLIDDDLVETATQHVVLTPAYAAPEQFQPGPAATSMDVYSLGVLASELLLGGRLGPDATLPSSESSDTWQRWRRTDTELSHILRAALASDPRRRYSSAGHLADDLVRYLNREPLQVVPISGWYRLQKFVSRHRAVVSAAVLVLLAFVLGATGVVYQWRDARNQANLARQQATRAQEQAKRAGAIRNFLVSVFQAGDAETPLDKQPSISDVVLDAERRLQDDEKLSGAIKVDLLLTLADVASSVGAFDRADHLLDQVALTPIASAAEQNEAEIRIRVRRASNLLAESTSKADEVRAILQPILPALNKRNDEVALTGLMNDAKALENSGHATEALKAAQAIAERYRNANEPRLTLIALTGLVAIAVDGQLYREAEPIAKTAVTFWEEHGRSMNPGAMSLWSDAAIAREFTGDIAGAEEAYRKAIDIGDRIFAHPTVPEAAIIEIYGTFLIVQSRADEAEVQIRRALQMERSIYGDDDPRTAQAVYGMSRLYGTRGNLPEAIRWATQAITLYTKNEHDPMLARALTARARYYAQAGDLHDAEADIADALDHQTALTGVDSAAYASILVQRVSLLLRQKKYEDALRGVDQTQTIYAGAGESNSQDALATRFYRARAFAGLGRREEALSELREIEPAYAKVAPKNTYRFAMAELRAIVLSELGRVAQAHDAAVEALQLPKPLQPDATLMNRLLKIAATKTGDSNPGKN